MTRDALPRIVTLCAALLLAAGVALSQAPRQPGAIFPVNAQALEGLPQVRIDITKERPCGASSLRLKPRRADSRSRLEMDNSIGGIALVFR
jgi:hypothetical protein